ncbi:hypothetical protein AXF42_Ash003358 [Apostasia shenzhenica]|uniref:Uncharacterized protein n=1 Tax=Apostasia shenzhenica TaxID=1088818 RepID=A0A2I0BFX0_9ASPA|nr:hypothetical protein AXF42_Ash003358 [Apostasia shenzhenica]
MLAGDVDGVEMYKVRVFSDVSGDECCQSDSSKEASLSGRSCTSLSSLGDIQELDRIGIWVSSLDLKLEDSELILPKYWVDLSMFDFPSPSYSSSKYIRSESSFCSSSSVSYFDQTESSSSSSTDLENDEPLFWPYSSDQKPFKLSEFGKNFLCISPRKDVWNVENKGLNDAKSFEVRISQKIELSPAPMKSASNHKTIVRCNNSRRPSRLSISSLSEIEELLRKPLLQFEVCHLLDNLVHGVTIEMMVRLDEFDGHEGLNSCMDEHFDLECN